MTSPPSPLNRRRRRIVVAVAVLAVGLCWWYYPRGDARFVGKWDAVGLDKGQPVGSFTFYANGTVSFTWYGVRHLTSWRLEGESIVFGPREPLRPVINRVERLLGVSLPGQFSTGFEIVEAAGDKCQLWPALLPCEPIELTRIPQ